MRRVALALLALLGLAVVAAALILAGAHRSIRSVRPALPEPQALVTVDATADLPTGLFVIETARQGMPRSAVLDPSRDPDPGADYVMTHPAFVLAWPDGRLFLFEAGMDRDEAESFGAPLELAAGADPIRIGASLARRLGPAVHRLRGVAVSHLHTDHTAGLRELCPLREDALPLFQTPQQHELGNYTTWAGRAQIESAGCVEPVRLEPAPRMPVPGFPGLWLVSAAGHTPGSQMLVAHVRTGPEVAVWVFTGDVVNHRAGVEQNLPKPRLYSLLVVPEDTARLERVRRLLAELARGPAVRLAVSHDARGLEARGAPSWPAAPPAGR